jgi:hypothetical protein
MISNCEANLILGTKAQSDVIRQRALGYEIEKSIWTRERWRNRRMEHTT